MTKLIEAKKSKFIIKYNANGTVEKLVAPNDFQIGLKENPSLLSIIGNFSLDFKIINVDKPNTQKIYLIADRSFFGIKNTLLVAPTVYLSIPSLIGQIIIIKDVSGNAATYNITIDAGSKTIEGSTTSTINSNYGSISLIWSGSEWVTFASASSGAPANAQYLTLASNSTLTAERVLTQDVGISITDNGANSTAVIKTLGTRIAEDSNTFHAWKMNETGTPFVDTGSSATNLTTIVNSANVVPSEVGIFNDSTYFISTGYIKTANDVGIPTSTTAISLHAWVKARAFSVFPRIITKAYNTGWTSPFVSLELILGNNAGDVIVQWASAGALKGTTGSGGREIILLNSWYHLGATLSQGGGNMVAKIYINGTQTSSQTIASGAIDWNSGASGPWAIGGSGIAGVASLDGWIFDARVDDGIVRSASYFKTLYKSGISLGY